MRVQTVGSRLAAVGGICALVVGLAAPVEAAERTLHDKRGDVKVADLVATKLMNNKNRLMVRTTFAKRSFTGSSSTVTILRSTRRRVKFFVIINWTKKHEPWGIVMRRPVNHPRAERVITKRCDLKLHRKLNVVRFSVDSDRCFRKAAGPMRFGTAAVRSEDRAPQKRWVTKQAVNRG